MSRVEQLAEDLWFDGQKALRLANRWHHAADLAGVCFHDSEDALNWCPMKDECGGMDPYLLIVETCQQIIKNALELKGHQHEWGDDDYCRVCGADGRA